MVDLLAFLHGRWSKVPPTRAGLYFMRIGTATPAHVGQWNVSGADDLEAGAAAPSTAPRGNDWEFFYLAGDVDGEPTPADDPRAVREALANGWRPFRSSMDQAAPQQAPSTSADASASGVKPPDPGFA